MSDDFHPPWAPGWREAAWEKIGEPWDLIIIGGGITGAGILAVAARCGVRALLLEKGDFGSGTSSRSSKLVHGGLRYLKHMQVKLTRESVQERQYLLRAAPGLVEPLGFIYPVYKGAKPSPWVVQLGLGIYTRLASDAGKSKRLDREDISLLAPGLKIDGLERGFHYTDAQTDDARLILRLLHDALAHAPRRALALNYCQVTGLVKKGNLVCGVRVKDEVSADTAELAAGLVINATGVWADELRRQVGARTRLRPLRGSHLFFSFERFPVYQAVAFSHPDDGRPVFVFPWEGVTLVGTTDVDHDRSLSSEPSVSQEEADYLLRAVQSIFPELDLRKADVISTQAGVRPVISSGKKDPSEESREHAVWLENGLLTVTGGKLTTFRMIALDALREAHKANKKIPEPPGDVEVFELVEPGSIRARVDASRVRFLKGRYGRDASSIISDSPGHLETIEDSPYIWSELAWSAKHEAVHHLDDLLLRRLRLGIVRKDGGSGLLPRVKSIVQGQLGWDEDRWASEVERFLRIRGTAHGLPEEWRNTHDSGS
jgi:glycerol-3-phosphate dehydrogenase